MTTATQSSSAGARRLYGQVCQSVPEDLDDVSDLLRRSFQASDGAVFASRAALKWKYIEPAELGLEDASFVLGSGGRIVAHAGLRTLTFLSPAGARVKCGTIIDWAADASAPGAGIALYRHLMGQSTATYLIGGTVTTQNVAARLGFQRRHRARVFARWVRPLDEFFKRPLTARSALRLLHGVAHASIDRLAPTRGWSLEPAAAFDDAATAVFRAASSPYSAAERSAAQFNHRLRSPIGETRGYNLFHDGRLAACALVSIGSWNARILAVQGTLRDADDLAAAYSLITDDLAREPRVSRVQVLASAPQAQSALSANGYWVNRVEPVSFHDPLNRAAELGTIDIQYLDTDIDDYTP